MTSIDLNADLGEGGPNDEALLEVVSSASIACGGHAGDETSMRAALRAAKARGVAVGAHPGFADREHFGRRRLLLPPEELDKQVREQVSTFLGLAAQEGVTVHYVKLHGALANLAAEERAVAIVAFAAIVGLQHGIAILAIDGSAQVEAAEVLGFPVIREAYADRAYLPNGLLVPRSEPGAVIHEGNMVAERAVRLALRGEIVAVDGTVLPSEARSLCVHGDTPAAAEIARQARAALEAAGVEVSACVPHAR